MGVNRCVCRGVKFTTLLALSKRVGPDIDRLAEETGCGTSCGLCIPYILEMLRTGKTDIPVELPAQEEPPARAGGS
jgi:bacterioferritin-associated ferredoxin